MSTAETAGLGAGSGEGCGGSAEEEEEEEEARSSPDTTPPTSIPSTRSHSRHFNMARKMLGGLLKMGRPQQPEASCPPSGGGGGGVDHPTSEGLSDTTRRHSDPSFRGSFFPGVTGRFTRKASSRSTGSNSKDNTYSPPRGPSPKGRRSRRRVTSSRPTTTTSWRPLTAMERHGVKAMLQLAAGADRRHEQRAHLEKTVLLMLDQLDVDVDVTALVDNVQRLQLMQWSVINGWHQVMEQLLERGHSPNMDNDCNGPLHLAAKLDDVRAAQLLMKYGASLHTKATACYPSNSLHLMHNSPFGPSAYCYVHFNSTPLQIALAHNNVDVVKLLMELTSWPTPEAQALILHQACRSQADSCVEYLIKAMPSSINVRDPDTGDTPLCIALDVGESLVRTLLQSGVPIEPDVLRQCNKGGDCVLHRLYLTEVCPNILTLTLLLQECGVDLVDCQDRTWNTPLHLLCSRMTRLGRRSEYNVELLPDIFLCAQYLISRSTRPNATNRKGESVLHMLFSGCWISFQHQFKYLEPFLKETNKLLRSLLSYGVDPDIKSDEASTVINTVINCCCGLGAEKAFKIGHHLVDMIETLCEFKADLNTPDEKGIYMLSRMLTACSRWLLHCVGNSGDPPARLVFSFMVGILQTLFKAGMQPPHNILRISVKQLAIITISPFDKSGFSNDIKDLLGLILCSGLNPNTGLLGVSADCSVDDVKTDDIRYCIARGFVTHREHDGMLIFFSIFEDTLTQPNLNAFTSMITLLLQTIFHESFFKNVSQCANKLRAVTLQPRPLRRLCRITINNGLNWKVLEKSRYLPLPTPLQHYLCDFS